MLSRSDQWRGTGAYYTLVGANGTSQVAPQATSQGTYQGTKELLGLLAGGERLSQQQMDNQIVALCADRPQKARELAHTLRRSAGHLSDAYLSRLVREGRLRLTGSPNDPNVAYQAGR